MVVSIEPSDAEHCLLQLTSSVDLAVNGTALSGSARLFGASSVLCLVGAGVISATGFQASSVVHLSHPKYFSQWLLLLLLLLSTVDMTILIPVVYDICVELNYGAAMSGLVLGSHLALQPVGLFLGRLVTSQPYARQRRIVVIGSWVLALLTWSGVAVLEMSRRWQASRVMLLLLASRALGGLFNTFVSTPLEALAFQGASMDNRATLSLWYFLSLGVGMCLGPLLCSTLLEIHKASDASVGGQDAVSFVGTLWSIYALLLTMFLPSLPEASVCSLEEQEAAVENDDWDRVSEAQRKSLVWAVVSFTAERAFTSSAIEVATGLILETQYGWKVQSIGFVMGAVFAGTVVMGCLALFVRGRWVSDRHLMMILAVASTLGSLCFVDWAGVGGPHSALLLLLADVLNFTCMFQLSGFMDGVAMQATVPDSPCSLQNYIVLKQLAIFIPRALAPPLVRCVIAALGRNAYAAAQIALTLTAATSVGFVAPFAKEAKGEEPPSNLPLQPGKMQTPQ